MAKNPAKQFHLLSYLLVQKGYIAGYTFSLEFTGCFDVQAEEGCGEEAQG